MKPPYDHNLGSFFENSCAKLWRKENKKTGISAKDWWEQNKHRDIDKERSDRFLRVAGFIMAICGLVTLVYVLIYIFNHTTNIL